MDEKRVHSHTYLVGYQGGPCPGCGYTGTLREVHTYGGPDGKRVLVHGEEADQAVSCVIDTTGMITTSPQGDWRFDSEATF